jgi:hypothetical protein
MMSDLLNNIRFSYRYRDAANYKLYGETIFSNPDKITITEIIFRIKACLIDGEFFNPNEWGIWALNFEVFDGELDHDWHEYEEIEETPDEITDKRSIKIFIETIKCK